MSCVDLWISILSPHSRACPIWPSAVMSSRLSLRAVLMLTRLLSVTTSGRELSVCGQIRLITNTFVSGIRIGPPADIECPVLPVGVEMIRPSQR